MRGSRGRDHTPAALTYVGKLVVEKKPSGSTPSMGAGAKRASGAPASGDASKLVGRYWNRGRVTVADSPRSRKVKRPEPNPSPQQHDAGTAPSARGAMLDRDRQ